MVDGEASIHNIMGGMESTGGVRLHNHKRKLKQRFDIIKKLGQGTYGKVQLGINKETGQEVAIKTIKKCKIETEADLIRIRREIQIMSSVQHPNIIHIYEVFENREKMVLVMEYAAGGELYDYLSEHKVLTELEARRIFRQISTAVFYCHKHKICHRDLKLENILLDQSGNAKIADFGLSNVFDERRLLNTFCGSALYASPEIVNGTPYHGPEVDCWSLGVLLYTLVYGAMPFDGTNFKRLVKQISESDYREPKKPSRASPLIKAMLTVSPSRRADIEKICTHWWVNEGYEQNCLDIAEDLAAQTPVRLDLLLSLVPQSASAEKLVIGSDQPPQPSDIANNISSGTLVPTRSHSVGSLMELNQNNSDRRIREMVQEDSTPKVKTKMGISADAKRKLETTPSMEETTAAGIKRKEPTRRKEPVDDRNVKPYISSAKHHSAPIPSSILEEAMEIDSSVVVSVPTSKTVDLKKTGSSMSCLEVKEEKLKEKLPNKEQNKTPIISDHPQNLTKNILENNSSVTTPTFLNKLSEKEKGSPEQESLSLKKTLSQNYTEEKNLSKTALSKEKSPSNVSEVTNNKMPIQKDIGKTSEDAQQHSKKLRNKSLSLDCDMISDESIPKPSTERRRSKIFETAEKFNQLASPVESEKPKKIFIPGVNVGGAKLVFERKASLSSTTVPQIVKAPVAKVIIDVPSFNKQSDNEKSPEVDQKEKDKKRDEEKKRAVDIITGALGKPPMLRKTSGSPPISPQSNETKKLGLKIPLGPNDLRNATVTVTTPTETKFPFESKPELHAKAVVVSPDTSSHEISKPATDEPKKCSKMEITLKSATLPRPHKTSKTEITLSGPKSNDAFRSQVEAKIDAFQLQKLRTQRSEVAFPVAAVVPQTLRSSSLEPAIRSGNRSSFGERVIPIQMEPVPQQATVHSTTPPPKPPVPQRSISQRSSSLSRQSTAESDTDSALGSTLGPEPIRKSPREYIIPIAVEGGGYVTPRSGSLEPEGQNGTPTNSNSPRSRFSKPRRMSSLLSDASEDESPFSSLHRDNDDLLQRHMHRLRSSRPPRQAPEHADSLSSGEDDDDDGFELLTAENLFSTLLSRVRSLTQRLNVDDNRASGFPSSRILSRLGSNSPQGFWGIHEPLSRRISDSQFRRSMSRDNNERFGRQESTGANSSVSQQNSPGTRTPSRDSLFDARSNTLPRAKGEQLSLSGELRGNPEQSPEWNLDRNLERNPERNPELSFTPCLTRRLSRHFIERTRQSLPRDDTYRSPLPFTLDGLDRLRSRSQERTYAGMRRANSLLEPTLTRHERRSPRRSISLFDDEGRYLPPLPLGRKYRDSSKLSTTPIVVEKIQEEQPEELPPSDIKNEFKGISHYDCASFPSTNRPETTARSKSAQSGDTSPTESTSNILDYSSSCKNNSSTSDSFVNKELHSRLLAAENLIKESKLKNLGFSKYNPNLSSNYQELEKCDKESLGAMSETASAAIAKRRSCIPSLRLRAGSLSRENSLSRDTSAKFGGSQDAMGPHTLTPERSLLSKIFRTSNDDTKEKSEIQQNPKTRQRRISRFLRPDFFDTPREESQYVKEKEAQKAAENERRKSRFMKRKSESRSQEDERPDKDEKNEANALMKNSEDEIKPQIVKSRFLQTLERKLEKFRSVDDSSKVIDENESNVSFKRTISTSDLSTSSSNTSTQLPPKSKVNSVLNLFKNSESKCDQNGSGSSRTPAQTILSRLRKSPYKGSKTDVIVDTSASKIPTKFSKNEVKSNKKLSETSKSPEKSVLSFKKSPSKEKEKEKETSLSKRISPEMKKPPMEKLTMTLKKSPEKLLNGKTEKAETPLEGKKDGLSSKISDRKKSPDVSAIKKNSSPDNMLLKSKLPDKIFDNKQIEDINEEFDEKCMPKLKKKILSSTTVSENTSSIKSDKIDNGKTVKKVIKTKEPTDKDGGESTKKKRIVRVVRKVVKKSSDNSENKEEKEKPIKSSVKKAIVSKTDKSLELPTLISNIQRKSPENKTIQNQQIPESKIKTTIDVTSINQNTKSNNMEKACNNVELSSSKIENDIIQSEITEVKPNREKLKLDFSKIPQHNFRNITPPKRESPKRETPKSEIAEISKLTQRSQSDNVSGKLMDNLSKLTNKVTIAGNKSIIDKPVQAKDTTDVKMKSQVGTSSISKKGNCEEKTESFSNKSFKENNIKFNSINNSSDKVKNNKKEQKEIKMSSCSLKDRSSTDDLVSPTEDTESFDSWSICSADINHTRGDLHSPTSPTYSMYVHGNNPNIESVVDRIRRKSFYSRFNDRKRKASLNAPPPGINISSSLTLPRKFSFHSSRDISKDQKNKVNNYTLPNRKNSEKSYSMYNDDALFRKSPIERDRYSDGGSSSYSNDLKSPSESYGHISSSFDPLRKYLSPTFNSSTARRKYHSSEFSTDNDLDSYRNSSQIDSMLDSSLNTNMSTLPRRYGRNVSGFEPKTVAYYEELLAPNNTDYLRGSKASPVSYENFNKFENGHFNGNIDLPQINSERWKSHSNKASRTDLTEGKQTEECTRKLIQSMHEPDDLSSNSLNQRASTSTDE